MKSWQLRILIVKSPQQNCWLVDSAADVHVCNNKKLMINFTKNPTKIERSTLYGISLGREKIKIRLALKNRTEGLILPLTNVFYLPNSLSNHVSLGLLNNAEIYHHNRDQILYNLEIQKTLAFAKQYKTSFFLHPLNQSAIDVNLLKNSEIYKEETLNMNQTKDEKLFLICWYQYLGHLNFTLLKKYFANHNIASIDDTIGYVYDSYEKAKATKQYNQTPQ